MKSPHSSMGLYMTIFTLFQVLMGCSVYPTMDDSKYASPIIISPKDLSPAETITKSPLIGYEYSAVHAYLAQSKIGKAEIKFGQLELPVFDQGIKDIVDVGLASFGKLIVTTAKEEGMIISGSITKMGDIYIVRFAVSFSIRNIESIEQLSLSIAV